jgi:hypothetical protein
MVFDGPGTAAGIAGRGGGLAAPAMAPCPSAVGGDDGFAPQAATAPTAPTAPTASIPRNARRDDVSRTGQSCDPVPEVLRATTEPSSQR